MTAPTEVRPRVPARWAVLLAGPVVGTVYFWLVYLLAEAGCSEDLELVSETTLRIVVLAGAAATIGVLHVRRRGGPVTPGGAAGADLGGDETTGARAENERFMASTALTLLGLFLLFVAVPRRAGDRGVAVLSLVAHGGPIDPSELWSAWSTDPLVWLLLVVPGLAYLELWRRAGRRDRTARWHRRSFLAGTRRRRCRAASPRSTPWAARCRRPTWCSTCC